MNQRTSWKDSRPVARVYDRPKVGDSLNSLGALREIAQPAPLKFEGAVNTWYKTVRNGVTSKIFLVEIRKDQALFKGKEDDKHTQNLSLAKFMKYYVAV